MYPLFNDGPINDGPISSKGSILYDFVQHFHGSCKVKDAKTRKCLLANYDSIEWWGIESIEDIIGITAEELIVRIPSIRRERLHSNNVVASWEKQQVERIKKSEDYIYSTRRPISLNYFSLRFNGYIYYTNRKQIPIIGSGQQVTAICSLFYDRTPFFSLPELLQIYLKYYSKQQEAIQFFLSYLNIDQYFCELPTLQELRILLEMCIDPHHKCIARRLDLSVGTVELYAHHIRDKLTSTAPSLHDILIELRMRSIKKNGEYEYDSPM